MKALYWIIGAVVVVGGAWVVMGMPTNLGLGGWGDGDASKNTQGDTSGPTQTTAPSNETQQFKGSMQSLMVRGGSWRCDVSVMTEGITTSGTTYVAKGMVRSDFVSNVPQVGNVESHMIMRDNTAYTWSSMTKQGFKFPIQGGEAQPEVSAEVAAQVNQEYDYKCTAWPTDESKFVLPSGITF